MKKILVFISITLMVSVITSCNFINSDYYIFSDISECENFNDKENVEYTIYNTVKNDKNLLDLEYERFFAAKYRLNDLEFEIFAYEFKNCEIAKKYFQQCTGRKSEINANFYATAGVTNYQLTVINEKNAYVAYTTSSNQENLNDFFAETFSVNVNEKVSHIKKIATQGDGSLS